MNSTGIEDKDVRVVCGKNVSGAEKNAEPKSPVLSFLCQKLFNIEGQRCLFELKESYAQIPAAKIAN